MAERQSQQQPERRGVRIDTDALTEEDFMTEAERQAARAAEQQPRPDLSQTEENSNGQ